MQDPTTHQSTDYDSEEQRHFCPVTCFAPCPNDPLINPADIIRNATEQRCRATRQFKESCSKSTMKAVTAQAGANAISAFVSVGTAWSISSKEAVANRVARGAAICIGLGNTVLLAYLSGRIVYSFVLMGQNTGDGEYPSIPPHWLVVLCASTGMGLGFLYRLVRLVAVDAAAAACCRKRGAGLSISADAPSVGGSEEERRIGEHPTSMMMKTQQQQRGANPDSPLYSVRANEGRVRELLKGFHGSRRRAYDATPAPKSPSLPTYDNPEEYAYEDEGSTCDDAAAAASADPPPPPPPPPPTARSEADSNASAGDYLRYNSTLVAAVVAALCTIFTLSVNAWKSLSNSFAHGFLQCAMSLTVQGHGLRDGCGQLGPCGKSVQRMFAEFEGNFGVDPGTFSSQVPFGFACEAGPFENATRAQWPFVGGAVKCKTTIIVAKIVSIVFGVCSLSAGLAICVMLFKMLGNYRTTMLQLRRGDWSAIPKEMRGMKSVAAIYQGPMFVSSVWWYSIVGFYIYLGVFMGACFALTPFVLALGPWGPLMANSTKHSSIIHGGAKTAMLQWLWNTIYHIAAPYLIWMVASNIAVRWFLIKKSRDGLLGRSVTRNHTLAHWQFYIGINIPKNQPKYLKEEKKSSARLGTRNDVLENADSRAALLPPRVELKLRGPPVSSRPPVVQFCSSGNCYMLTCACSH